MDKPSFPRKLGAKKAKAAMEKGFLQCGQCGDGVPKVRKRGGEHSH